ncbi:MAG: hypothetical protein H6Q88_3519 [Anaeromyxobacteraceae bacterium]|nr:hypothetical protein [Anaeromyxobacteraceae bacterium]
MDLDTMQERWKSLDARLDACIRLDRQLLRESVERRLRSHARWEVALRLPGLALDVVAVAWLGSFLANHAAEPGLAVPALLVLAFVVVTGSATVRHLLLVGRIDLAGPVVKSQRLLQERKAERIRASLAVFLLAPAARRRPGGTKPLGRDGVARRPRPVRARRGRAIGEPAADGAGRYNPSSAITRVSAAAVAATTFSTCARSGAPNAGSSSSRLSSCSAT